MKSKTDIKIALALMTLGQVAMTAALIRGYWVDTVITAFVILLGLWLLPVKDAIG